MKKYAFFAIGLLVAALAHAFDSNQTSPPLEAAPQLIESGAGVSATPDAGNTTPLNTTKLMVAVSRGDTATVRQLIEKGVDVNATSSSHGRTALMVAVEKDYPDIARLLIESGADVTSGSNSDALLLALKRKRTDVARLLIEGGVDVNVTRLECSGSGRHRTCHGGHTALMDAAAAGHTDIARLLLEHDADANASCERGTTALKWAVRSGHTATVRLLLEKGADADATGNNSSFTALMSAADRGRTDIVRLLLEHGANINAADRDGVTALMGAASKGHTDTVRLLIERGADLDAVDKRGRSALVRAEYEKHTNIAQILKNAGAKDDHAPPGAKEKLAYLMEKHARQLFGFFLIAIIALSLILLLWLGKRATPLLEAAKKGNTNAVRQLLDKGVNVNVVNEPTVVNQQYTGLIIDCRGMNINCVMSPVVKNADGTPIYGHKNLDYDKIIVNGMAAYSTDAYDQISKQRAGNNPLVIKAVRLDDLSANPVVSVADADKILAANSHDRFLDNCAVVFVK